MKRGLILTILLLLLAALLVVRFRYPLSGPDAVSGEPPAPSSPEATDVAEPEESPEPEPTPEESPEPTPAPTPRPLLEPQLADETIDESFFAPCEQGGTLLTDLHYSTRDYVYGREEPFEKTMQVYLPYGYDEGQPYDVLFLLHIRQSYASFWLEWPHDYDLPGGGSVSVDAVHLLDNLIARGLCKPMIVVALDGYLDDGSRWVHNSDQVYPQFAQEFCNDILPFVVERFSTFAEGGERAQLAAAREHFGVLGASFGAYQAELSVLGPNLDLVSWYALTGGGSVTQNYLLPQWQLYGTQGLPLSLLYFVEGEYDDIGPVESSYLNLGDWTGTFTRDENLRFTRVLGAGHNQREWVNALFNAAQLFFR